MKKLGFILGFLLIGLGAFAQTSIKPIMEAGYQFVSEIERQYGTGTIIQRAEFDFAFDDNYSYLDVSPDLKYVIAAIGDENVTDISLMVYCKVNGEWKLLVQDSEKAPKAVVEFTPTEKAEYALDVRVNSYKNINKIGHVGTFVLVTKK